MIRWVLLDVGNVLLDEDPLTFVSFRRHTEAVRRVDPERSFLDLLAERERRAATGSRWPVFDVVSQFLDEAACTAVWEQTAAEVRARYTELSPVIPGAPAMVQRLAERYKLGLIANQAHECRQALMAHGLLDRFEVVAFSDDLGNRSPIPTCSTTRFGSPMPHRPSAS